MMSPMHGIKVISIIQPLLPVSCNLLTDEESSGIANTRKANKGRNNTTNPASGLTIERAKETIIAPIKNTLEMTKYPRYPTSIQIEMPFR